MSVKQKSLNLMRRVLQSYSGTTAKRLLWNSEFSRGHWNFLENVGKHDHLFGVLERHLRGGDILDLGCGSGSTARELAGKCKNYVGIDISDVAISRARDITMSQNSAYSFVRYDIESYVPNQKFDVILFRDSIYYIPPSRVAAVIAHYQKYLNELGVILLRVAEGETRHAKLFRAIEERILPLEKLHFDKPLAVILVIR